MCSAVRFGEHHVRRSFPGRTGSMTGLCTTALIGFAAFAAGVTVPISKALGGGWRTGLVIWAVPAAVALVGWLLMPRDRAGDDDAGSTAHGRAAHGRAAHGRAAHGRALAQALEVVSTKTSTYTITNFQGKKSAAQPNLATPPVDVIASARPMTATEVKANCLGSVGSRAPARRAATSRSPRAAPAAVVRAQGTRDRADHGRRPDLTDPALRHIDLALLLELGGLGPFMLDAELQRHLDRDDAEQVHLGARGQARSDADRRLPRDLHRAGDPVRIVFGRRLVDTTRRSPIPLAAGSRAIRLRNQRGDRADSETRRTRCGELTRRIGGSLAHRVDQIRQLRGSFEPSIV
jgi:hypothetical protein